MTLEVWQYNVEGPHLVLGLLADHGMTKDIIHKDRETSLGELAFLIKLLSP